MLVGLAVLVVLSFAILSPKARHEHAWVVPVTAMGVATVVAVFWTVRDLDGWPDAFTVLPLAAVGMGALVALCTARLPRPFRFGSGLAWVGLATVLALVFSVTQRSHVLVDQRNAVTAALAQLPADATIVTMNAPQPLVLSGKRNPTRFMMFTGGLDQYMDDTWPGGLRQFGRDLDHGKPTLVAMGVPSRVWLKHAVKANYVRVGKAPGWVWFARKSLGEAELRRLRDAIHHPARAAREGPGGAVVERVGTGAPRPVSASRRDARALAIGSAVSGLLAYLVFALTTRGLGAEQAGPVSVLWSYWAFAGAAFTFPIQHWVAHSVTAHGEVSVRRSVPLLSLVILGSSLVLGGLAWLARESLFHRSDAWFPVMVAAITFGSALIGGMRGGLSARGRFVAVAWSLVAENGVRCAAAGVLLAAGDRRVVDYGLCLVAGQPRDRAVALGAAVRHRGRRHRWTASLRVPRGRQRVPADRAGGADRTADPARPGRRVAR